MAPTAYKDEDNVDLDVGILYVAPIGTAEPTSATSALDAAWREVGYTEDGSQITTGVSSEEVFVAELLDAVRTATTQRTTRVSFQMAQMTRANLLLALNQGAAGADNDTGVEPVATSAEVRVMLLWQSDQTGADQRRWLFRQCYNTGGLTIANRKAPQKRLMPVDFFCEKPSAAEVFEVFPSTTGEI